MSETNPSENYHAILDELAKHAQNHEQKTPQLVVVSKTFDADFIRPVLQAGARVFGENRVQEAQGKWPQLNREFENVELHLIGPLQSNKAGDAVQLFDCIQTIDREKIARAVAKEMRERNKVLDFFVQVNTGKESQKAGIHPEQAGEFIKWCREDVSLTVRGLMCIPPFEENPGPHFALLRKLSEENAVADLSMGMSADYLTATEFGATHVRVGSGVFGARG
ncbi:MAG: YggS family pyridoxal phosphate-dependent enzyme [Pseudomonadota bacterium]